MGKFPIYLTLTLYNDYKELETLLRRLDQEYVMSLLADIAYISTEGGGMLKYNVPLMKVKIRNAMALESIICDSFWMAESNCTYILSFSDNIKFINRVGKDWKGKEAEFSTLLIDMTEEITTITVTHDAYSLLLFSNSEENRSVEMIAKQLPNYTILTGG